MHAMFFLLCVISYGIMGCLVGFDIVVGFLWRNDIVMEGMIISALVGSGVGAVRSMFLRNALLK